MVEWVSGTGGSRLRISGEGELRVPLVEERGDYVPWGAQRRTRVSWEEGIYGGMRAVGWSAARLSSGGCFHLGAPTSHHCSGVWWISRAPGTNTAPIAGQRTQMKKMDKKPLALAKNAKEGMDLLEGDKQMHYTCMHGTRNINANVNISTSYWETMS